MTAAMALPGNTADTFLVHLFGTGLADEKYVVERFKAMADGDIRPIRTEAAGANGRRKAEAHGRLAQAGRGDASRPDGDHHLHGAPHPRRPAGVGCRGPGPVLRPQAARLSSALGGRPAGPTPAAWRPPAPDRVPGVGTRRGVPPITPPVMEETVAYRDPAVGRAKDRERFRRRVERRKAAGLCPRCGDRAPAPERSICAPCADNSNRASRKRDARLRAEGKPRRDPAKARDYERERARREMAKRAARGSCIRCGRHPAMPGRKSCVPCLEKRRAADRARYAAGKAAGLKYGGADAEAKRRAGRAKSKRRQKARIEAGLCIRCGKQRPVEGGTTCTPCRNEAPAGREAAICRKAHRRLLHAVRRSRP